MDVLELSKQDRIKQLLSAAYQSRVNNLQESISLANEALQLSQEISDKKAEGQSHNQLSLYYMIMGNHSETISHARTAIELFEKLKDEKGIADAKYNIAGVYYKTDNFHLGLVELIDCLKIYQKYNDFHNISRTEKSLGTIYEFFGDQNNAVRSYEQAIRAAQKIKDLNLESNAYNNLAGVYLKQNRIEEALSLVEQSIQKKNQTGDIRGLAFALYGRGKAFSRIGKIKEAEEDFKAAIEIHQKMSERMGLGMAYVKLGSLYIDAGRIKEAKVLLKEGVALSDLYNIIMTRYKCEHLLYQIAKLEQNFEVACQHLENYNSLRNKVINSQTLKVIENYELILQMRTMEKEAQLQKEKAGILEKKKRAEESARIRQEFLSIMSHEIRTPLNAVTTIVSLLKDRTEGEEKQMVESLKFASNHLMRIINDILDFTKLESGKVVLEMRQSEIKPLLENIVLTYQESAIKKGVALNLEFCDKLADYYELDETKFRQIIGNLISNAIKFTDKGKVDVKVGIQSEGAVFDAINFEVSDTGEGIDPTHLEEVFNVFSQTKPITTRKQGGTGLGLAIVKKLLLLFDSEIKVNSTLGQGSVFSFTLELRKKIASNSINDIDYTKKLRGKVALLAEDNEINAFVAKNLLEQWGIITDHAENGIIAYEMTRNKKYDFVLMDIHMPEMNGFDAAKNIRESTDNRTLPIFALTADTTACDNEDYFDYFNGFLWKPLQIEKLYEVLCEAF